MSVDTIVHDPSFVAIYVMLILSFANFVAGSVRAGINGIFHLPAWSAWINKDGQSIIIVLVLLAVAAAMSVVDTSSLGIGDLGTSFFRLMGIAYAGTFILSRIGSLKDSITPPDPTLLPAKLAKAAKAGDSVPLDSLPPASA